MVFNYFILQVLRWICIFLFQNFLLFFLQAFHYIIWRCQNQRFYFFLFLLGCFPSISKPAKVLRSIIKFKFFTIWFKLEEIDKIPSPILALSFSLISIRFSKNDIWLNWIWNIHCHDIFHSCLRYKRYGNFFFITSS